MSTTDTINILKLTLIYMIQKKWLGKMVTFNIHKNKTITIDRLHPNDIIGRDKDYYEYIYKSYPRSFILDKCEDIYGDINTNNIEKVLDIMYELDDGCLEIEEGDIVELTLFNNEKYRVDNISSTQGSSKIYRLVNINNTHTDYVYSSREDIIRITRNPSYYYMGYYKSLLIQDIEQFKKNNYIYNTSTT